MYLYAGKIICSDCGQRYRGKKQHGKNIYLDSGYHNKLSDCPRFAIKESELTDLIVKHFESIYRYDYQKADFVKKYGVLSPADYLDRVDVSGKEKSFNIYYIDGTVSKVGTLNYFL